MLEFLTGLYGMAFSLLPSIKFKKWSETDRTIMALYATIIEQTDSALALLHMKKPATLQIILRSTTEAMVDLANLLKSSDFLKNMQAAHCKDWLKLMNEGAIGNNPFLPTFDQESIERHKTRLLELREEGFRPLQVLERFERAGMKDQYVGVYAGLCSESHNNLKALQERHINVTEETVDVVIFSQPEELFLETAIDSFAGLLAISTFMVHRHFGSPEIEQVTTYVAMLQEKRKTVFEKLLGQ